MDTQTLKFIVLADLHIVPEGTLSHGINTFDRLKQAVAFVNEHHHDTDFVVFAGDLTDHSEAEAYLRFKSVVDTLTPQAYVTLGNHDDRPTFLQTMGATPAETGNMDHVIDVKGYRVIVLDTFDPDPDIPGSGSLEPAQIDWLKARLAEVQDKPVVVVLHHNIVPFHIHTDTIILKDGAAFVEALKSHKDIRQVISGHVHLTTSGTFNGIPFCTFAGSHYSVEPMLKSRSAGVLPPRREGPGQLAVVLCNDNSVVVHMENFLDRHLIMPQELFAGV